MNEARRAVVAKVTEDQLNAWLVKDAAENGLSFEAVVEVVMVTAYRVHARVVLTVSDVFDADFVRDSLREFEHRYLPRQLLDVEIVGAVS